MADYIGTDEDDIIDASELDSDIGNIYPGKGNDTVTNATIKHTIISGPGEDNISGINFKYAVWNAEQKVTINLQEGWAEDGFGTKDTISGVNTVSGNSYGINFYGTSSNEDIFVNGGDNYIESGGGEDTVIYYNKSSSNYSVSLVGEEIHIQGSSTLDKLKDVRYIEFREDNKIIDTNYYTNLLQANEQEIIYQFSDSTKNESYVYAGVERKADLITIQAQSVFLLDINNDGIEDAIFPIKYGYASGVDTSARFVALTSSDNSLTYDKSINETMPTTSGARTSNPIQLANSETLSYVTTNHDTEQESNRDNPDRKIPYSELRIVQSVDSKIKQSEIIPSLLNSTTEQPFLVDAHASGVGDINGDGLDDILVGHWTGEKAYALIQNSDGTFFIQEQDLFKKIINWPTELKFDDGSNKYNLFRDASVVDVNDDGYHDLIAGFGYADAPSMIFINNEGEFSEDNKIDLPTSKYSLENQLHSKTLDADFDHDGDEDLAILYLQKEGYYAGNYLQILLNDGLGNFSDVTDLIPADAYKYAYLTRLNWHEPWQLIDMNNDNHIDIAGGIAKDNIGSPLIYFNDGKGRFEIKEISLDATYGRVHIYNDFDGDNLMEFISMKSTPNSERTEQIISFHLYELTTEIGTGPEYTSSAKDSAPGFNERYYLNENISAKEAVDAGTYATGLEHYLAEGKDAGLKTFAPFTKVHGYAGKDTIVLREGDEIAYGYAGKDSIEGGAGNDAIDGGAGVDTAIYKDASSAYTLTANDDGTVSVVHSSPSENFIDEGTDTLTSIEKMQFSDQTLSKTSLKYKLSETIDSSENMLSAHTEDVLSGTLNFNKGNNIIILDGQGKTYRGLEGDDTYFVSHLLPKSGKVSITDTEGSNLVQLPANTYIDNSLFTKNAARLTLEDGREITISSADKFSYNVGGNVTNGTKGTDLTFTEFAEVFGVYDILNSSGAQTGEISDMYII